MSGKGQADMTKKIFQTFGNSSFLTALGRNLPKLALFQTLKGV